MLAIHLDGAFLTTKACVRTCTSRAAAAHLHGVGAQHEASALKAAYVAAKHGLLGLARVMAKEGAQHSVRANVICPGFVLTPLVEKQIPEQAKEFGISEERVVKEVMLGETVDGSSPRRGRRRGSPIFRCLQNECTHRPVDVRQPWLAYELEAGSIESANQERNPMDTIKPLCVPKT